MSSKEKIREKIEKKKSTHLAPNSLPQRTHYCGDLNSTHVGKQVTLMGWIDNQRDHGGVLFISLRDRSGLIQIVFDDEYEKKANASHIESLKNLKNESVGAFWGLVNLRPKEKQNLKIKTGRIEIQCKGFHIFSKAKELPFQVSTKSTGFFTGSSLKEFKEKENLNSLKDEKASFENKVSENLRLKYRYLDLRSFKLQHFIFIRHKALQCIRQFFSKEGFLEIDTPILYKSTPEGAKDYLVPSRIYPENFYALPQSPQILKQLLMISGLDRYFQIAKCFRDEDLRENRQPEFSQIDMEMSFVQKEEEVMEINEKLLKILLEELLGVDIQLPLPCLSYEESLNRYGTDAPDLRIPWEFKDISSLASSMPCEIFKKALLKKTGKVIALKLPKIKTLSKTFLKKWTDRAKEFEAGGLIWIFKDDKNKWTSPIEKILSQKNLEKIFSFVPLNPNPKNSTLNSKNTHPTHTEHSEENQNSILFLVADKKKVALNFLLAIRAHFAKELKILNDKEFSFLWIKDFPLLDFDLEEKKWKALHHPFTMPKEDQIPILLKKEESKYSQITSRAYDLVCNGSEIAGGSLRNHSPQVQRAIFHALNLSEKEIKDKFGFFIEALEYGAPPHGGMAWGFDRLISLLCNTSALRDVVAFPKTRKAMDLMSGSPSDVPKSHLKELGIKKYSSS